MFAVLAAAALSRAIALHFQYSSAVKRSMKAGSHYEIPLLSLQVITFGAE
jgi:hypothetical protein